MANGLHWWLYVCTLAIMASVHTAIDAQLVIRTFRHTHQFIDERERERDRQIDREEGLRQINTQIDRYIQRERERERERERKKDGGKQERWKENERREKQMWNEGSGIGILGREKSREQQEERLRDWEEEGARMMEMEF